MSARSRSPRRAISQRITDFFSPAKPSKTEPRSRASKLTTFAAKIYGYFLPTGPCVYVGQTIQDVQARDARHIRDSETRFDRSYTRKGDYALRILDSRDFAAHCEEESPEYEALVDACQAWMDEKERELIAVHDTYRRGLNSTTGGQGIGTLRMFLEWRKKESRRRALEEWLPAVKRIVEELGMDINVPQGGYPDVEGSEEMGKLLHNIRSGHTTAPAEFMDYIQKHGFEENRREEVTKRRWEGYFNVIKRMVEEFGMDINVPRGGYPDVDGSEKIGNLLDSIRTGRTTAPAEFMDYIRKHGFEENRRGGDEEKMGRPLQCHKENSRARQGRQRAP